VVELGQNSENFWPTRSWWPGWRRLLRSPPGHLLCALYRITHNIFRLVFPSAGGTP
jgi:hypothetical protein